MKCLLLSTVWNIRAKTTCSGGESCIDTITMLWVPNQLKHYHMVQPNLPKVEYDSTINFNVRRTLLECQQHTTKLKHYHTSYSFLFDFDSNTNATTIKINKKQQQPQNVKSSSRVVLSWKMLIKAWWQEEVLLKFQSGKVQALCSYHRVTVSLMVCWYSSGSKQ